MSGIVSVYALFGSEEEAARLARAMIEERLAACANILGPCQSIYRWEGRIEEAREVPVIFKAAAEQATALVDALAARHSYAVPAITVWPIDVAPEAYVRWVRDLGQMGE
jgi:periplasmic divalent cation tolerance protein